MQKAALSAYGLPLVVAIVTIIAGNLGQPTSGKLVTKGLYINDKFVLGWTEGISHVKTWLSHIRHW